MISAPTPSVPIRRLGWRIKPLLLLRPKLLAIGNRWKRSSFASRARDYFLALIILLLSFSIYLGSYGILNKLASASHSFYVNPSSILSVFLLGLLCLVLFSSAIHMVGGLFFSADLDLTLAAPVTRPTLFFSKFCDALIHTSWMVIVFLIPLIFAFGSQAGGSLQFYLIGIFTLLPFFAIPVAAAMSIILGLAYLLPVTYGKGFVSGLALLAGASSIWLMNHIIPITSQPIKTEAFLGVISILTRPDSLWLPSSWAAHALQLGLTNNTAASLRYLALLYATALSLGSMAYLLLHLCHRAAYARTRSTLPRLTTSRQHRSFLLVRILSYMPTDVRAILLKEFRLFARDLTQALQLILLIGLCLVYLYNFGTVRHSKQLSPTSELWWDCLLIVCNTVLGAFVMAAVCSRFVFPSLSMEGRSFWILQKSPLSVYRILRIKFFTWLAPVATISSVILAAGALAIDAEPRIVVASIIMSWLMSYGLVGMAIGLGACYANFRWEHSTQLASGVGNFVYLILSAILIFVNAIPLSIIIGLRALKLSGFSFPPTLWYPSIIGSAVFLAFINFFVTWATMKRGARAIEKQAETHCSVTS